MKIYIVTSGSYSDYQIERVYLDRDKAEKYAELSNQVSDWSDTKVEDYETSDDLSELKVIEVVDYYYDYNTDKLDKSKYTTKKLTTTSSPRYALGRLKFDSQEFDSVFVVIEANKYTDDQVKKMLQDKWSEFKSLMDNEGWTKDMINDLYWKYE